MNDMFNMLSMIKQSGNPQQFITNMINNNPNIKNNPLMQNAFAMMKNGDNKGLETMARNLCSQYGINPDEMIKQISNITK